jgi:Flp pilus assembly protein TadG
MPQQRGQVVIVIALMAAVLFGFAGLAVDTSLLVGKDQGDQHAADAAALAAAYYVNAGLTPTDTAHATTYANKIAAADGCSAPCSLSYSWLDANGSATGTYTNIAQVQVSLSEVRKTAFSGVPYLAASATINVGATAVISNTGGGGGGTAWCAICVLHPGNVANTFQVAGIATLSVTGGGIEVVSTSTSGANVANSSTVNLTASTMQVGGTAMVVAARVTPTPLYSKTFSPADPMAYLNTSPVSIACGPPCPNSNNGTDITCPAAAACSPSLPAGVYHNLDITGSTTLGPGNFAITGYVKISAAGAVKMAAGGSMIYLTCPGYGTTPPTQCVTNSNGAYWDDKHDLGATGSDTITAPTTGTYKNISIYADPNNASTGATGSATIACEAASPVSYNGVVYAKSGKISFNLQAGDLGTSNVRFVSDTFYYNGTDSATTTVNSTGLPAGGPTISLTK